MLLRDLGLLPYNEAWSLQDHAHASVLAGAEEQLLLLEHTPVITLGRRPGMNQNVIASADRLAQLGIDLVHSDRGGDVTFHGPGQLVAYPIVRLNDHALSVGAYVRKLQNAVIATLAEFNVEAHLDPAAVGVWVNDHGQTAKICALGVRIRRGVSLHGLALNLTTDLDYFNLINPCGLGRPVTSLHRLLQDRTPSMPTLKQILSRHMIECFSQIHKMA